MLDHMSGEWRDWLILNVRRGVSRADLLKALIENQVLDQGGADAAIDAVSSLARPISSPPASSRPFLDFPGDSVTIGDTVIRRAMMVPSPRIQLLEGLLSMTECDHFIALARDRLEQATVIDQQTGDITTHQGRSGQFTCFQRGHDAFIDGLEQRIAQLLRWPLENGEGFQVIHYGIGDQYMPHYDWFDPTLSGIEQHLRAGGQRIATLIMYLNRPDRGGATQFPSLSGLTIAAQPGSGLYFDNLDGDFAPDHRVLHAGLPLESGEKWIATKWLRLAANR